ncbi:MAG: hypothetical protein QF758_04000, partial [Alphaproteobacteria bacterium]|nr:hypothetical protein [Alphaproteobacteria bacterium]
VSWLRKNLVDETANPCRPKEHLAAKSKWRYGLYRPQRQGAAGLLFVAVTITRPVRRRQADIAKEVGKP